MTPKPRPRISWVQYWNTIIPWPPDVRVTLATKLERQEKLAKAIDIARRGRANALEMAKSYAELARSLALRGADIAAPEAKSEIEFLRRVAHSAATTPSITPEALEAFGEGPEVAGGDDVEPPDLE